MGLTTHYNWNYGTRGQKPWWDEWVALWQAVDTKLYLQPFVDEVSGYVGIGTTSPQSSLDINGVTTLESYVVFQFGGDSGYMGAANYLFVGGETNSIGIRAIGKLYLSGNNSTTPHLTINTDGNVGIGTTSPGSLFTVGSDAFRIDSSGNVGIGVTPHPNTLFEIQRTISIASPSEAIMVDVSNSYVGANLNLYGIESIMRATGVSTHERIVYGFYSDPRVDASSADQKLYGFHANIQDADADYIYGLWVGAAQATTENWAIYSSFGNNYFGGSVGIGTPNPNANALLDITSTTKAFIPPRMTTTQKNAIASPIAGMVVYDATLNKLCVYAAAAWETVISVP